MIQVRTNDVSPKHLSPVVVTTLNKYREVIEAGALVTVDEFPRGATSALGVRVNGRVIGSGASALNLEQAAALVAGLSNRYAFRPGDIVGFPAGTPEIELPASSRVSLSINAALELEFATGA